LINVVKNRSLNAYKKNCAYVFLTTIVIIYQKPFINFSRFFEQTNKMLLT